MEGNVVQGRRQIDKPCSRLAVKVRKPSTKQESWRTGWELRGLVRAMCFAGRSSLLVGGVCSVAAPPNITIHRVETARAILTTVEIWTFV
ncbi:hypothetical protein VB711_03700 [Cronbergia sp. UHCC 0137]|uniref:hypothetical protein n=1 Tax=Cronbergia sp. UHCC 0137 TaxID=3110239 RepID=UPI002B20A67E|nr:hypothetical protein [Cronbergia sp. UHCC 0137]MEA5616948.1 hypothetical protein [Cronbergia sp. UHCC 0137]